MTPPRSVSLWLVVRLWSVVALFVGVAVLRSDQIGIPFRDPHSAYFASRVALTAAIFAALVIVEAMVRMGRPIGLRRVFFAVRDRWTPGRLAMAWAALLAYHVTYLTYHNLKSWNTFNSPRDDLLLRWDRWLFLGHSPSVLLHDLLGEHLAAWVLMVWYEIFPTMVVVTVPAVMVLAQRMRSAYVCIAALVWVWILGTASYYAIPSLGPFASAPDEFVGLPHMMIQDTQARYMAERSNLLAHPHAPDAVAQVAAFASLHVAVTGVILGIAWWLRLRRTTLVLSVFLLGTMVATVYLGWHFALDDLAGLGIAGLSWLLAPLTIGLRRRPPRLAPITATPFRPELPNVPA